jgi:hypothetical protein
MSVWKTGNGSASHSPKVQKVAIMGANEVAIARLLLVLFIECNLNVLGILF